MQIRSELKAGVVIVVACVLSGVILAAAGRWRSLMTKKRTIHVVFTDVQGLKVSDPVLVMGLELGKIERLGVIRYKDESGLEIPAIEITATVAYPEAFPIDTKVLASQSLTGSSQLSIEPGRAARAFGPDDRIRGTAPASLTDLGNQAGLIARRLDEFIKDITDREVAGAAREAVFNLKRVSEDAKAVMATVNKDLPVSEKSFTSSMRNLEQFTTTVNESVGKHGDKISETIANAHAASQSLARVGDNVDKMLSREKDSLHHAIANADKATSNIKELTREVRWQPWLLLHKPGSKELSERGAYNAALDFSEGAESLNGTVKDFLATLSASQGNGGPSAADQEKLKLLASQVHENLERSVELERKLWQSLTDKSKDK